MLGDFEVAPLECVQFGLKQFDPVFAFKDFHESPIAQHTNRRRPRQLELGPIMKTNDSPYEFFQGGVGRS